MGADIMNRGSNPAILPGETQESIEENISAEPRLETNIMRRDSPLKYSHAVDYLHSVESYMPKELASSQNLAEIKGLADHFTGGLTSFFGFESRLGNSEARSDYLFAVSSMKGERDALVNLFKSGNLPETFYNKTEWQQIGNFALAWANPKSQLYDKVIGLWFEFDTSDLSSEASIPSIFIHSVPIKSNSETSNYKWLTHTALPLLVGRRLSKIVEQRIIGCIQKMPSEATLYQIGTMLSRVTDGIHLVIKRIRPDQIIPYLKSIGWSDENEGLSSLLKELEKHVNRIVLHISVGEQVDPKIGIECSFYPGFNDKEAGWSEFLDYLIEKELCLSEKHSALLNFPGVEQEDASNDFNLKSYVPSVMIPDNNFSSALVRYISHVKIVYKPNHPLEAKAYYGIRLFGSANE